MTLNGMAGKLDSMGRESLPKSITLSRLMHSRRKEVIQTPSDVMYTWDVDVEREVKSKQLNSEFNFLKQCCLL